MVEQTDNRLEAAASVEETHGMSDENTISLIAGIKDLQRSSAAISPEWSLPELDFGIDSPKDSKEPESDGASSEQLDDTSADKPDDVSSEQSGDGPADQTDEGRKDKSEDDIDDIAPPSATEFDGSADIPDDVASPGEAKEKDTDKDQDDSDDGSERSKDKDPDGTGDGSAKSKDKDGPGDITERSKDEKGDKEDGIANIPDGTRDHGKSSADNGMSDSSKASKDQPKGDGKPSLGESARIKLEPGEMLNAPPLPDQIGRTGEHDQLDHREQRRELQTDLFDQSGQNASKAILQDLRKANQLSESTVNAISQAYNQAQQAGRSEGTEALLQSMRTSLAESGLSLSVYEYPGGVEMTLINRTGTPITSAEFATRRTRRN